MKSREEEAGLLYEQGAKAVSAGGHELSMLAGHLILMINGTVEYQGPLWPDRALPPRGTKFHLDHFIDYLLKPTREGLGLPSLHFLRQVLKASGKEGAQAFELTKQELAKEQIDFDGVADRERNEAVPKLPKPAKGGRGKKTRYNVTGFDANKGNSESYTLARLKRDHPKLAAKVVAGEMSANAAAIKAGFRKKPVKRCPKCGHEW